MTHFVRPGIFFHRTYSQLQIHFVDSRCTSTGENPAEACLVAFSMLWNSLRTQSFQIPTEELHMNRGTKKQWNYCMIKTESKVWIQFGWWNADCRDSKKLTWLFTRLQKWWQIEHYCVLYYNCNCNKILENRPNKLLRSPLKANKHA